MDARLIVSDELTHQTSLKTKILRWVQEHPCYDTNLTIMAHQFCNANGGRFQAVRGQFNCLIANQMLIRTGGKRKARFEVNYHHYQIPDEVLENAPADVQEDVAKYWELRHEQDQQNLEGVAGEVEQAEQVEPVQIKQTEDGITININLTIKMEK